MLRRMLWIFPDRESSRMSARWGAAFWDAYEEVAKDLDLSWERTPPEAITVEALDPRHPVFRVNGERITPADTLMITAPYTLPYQSADVFPQFTLYAVLEQAGFYLPHPPSFAAVGNDKMATLLFLKDCPVPPIPTIRIGTGRDLVHDEFLPAIRDLTYPAVVKPTGWATSRGINIARDAADVRGLLSLAQGGDTTLVLQPDLGRRTVDHRVYVIDGEARHTLVRAPGEGELYPQFSTGARLSFTDTPAELLPAIDYLAGRLPIPYFCADFLHDGERFWLSEIEPDGVIMCPDPGDAAVVRKQRELITARFTAYRRAHAHAHLRSA